jgi:hypothetical protein
VNRTAGETAEFRFAGNIVVVTLRSAGRAPTHVEGIVANTRQRDRHDHDAGRREVTRMGRAVC